MRERGARATGRKHGPPGVYVLRLAYCKNRFGDGDVGTVQQVFKS